ncbi:MAG TPA: hypothetical protein EYP64_04315 [Desulfarculaceae bacterium]|nr:hypothetical protein [Desulfarculaceae bacterium]
MSGFGREVVYRPSLLLLAIVIWSILAPVCCGFKIFPTFLSAGLLIFFYFLILRCHRVRPNFWKFLLFAVVALAAVWFGSLRIAARQADFLKVSGMLHDDRNTAATIISGRITTFPHGSPRGWQLRLRPLAEDPAGSGEILLKLPVTVYDDNRLPLIGDIVTVKVALQPLTAARHPFLRGRRRSQVLSGLTAWAQIDDFADIKIITPATGFLTRIEKIRRLIYRALADNAESPDSAAILQAVLIGSRDQLSFKVRELFLDFGVFHLFAISGLHLSVVVALLFFLCKAIIPDFIRRRLPKGTVPIAAGITMLFLPVYILLAGLHLPVVRAGIMALFFLLTLLSGRLRDPFSTLFLAAVVILLIWPAALFALSFQLSFTAVATILWIVPRSNEWWELRLLPLMCKRAAIFQAGCRYIFYLSASSMAISLTTAPLLINRVHFISIYSLIANLLLIPLFSLLIIPLGMLSLLFVKLPQIMALLLKLPAVVLDGLISGSKWLQEWLPAGRSYWASLTSFEIILVALIILTGGWMLTPSSSKKVTAVLLFILFAALGSDQIWWQYQQGRKKVAVAAFVGSRPQALLFELPGGEALLFNGGSWCGSSGSTESLTSPSFFSFAKNVIAPYCWRRKIKCIDTLVLTEPQRGLVGGLLFLVEHFQVREIWYHGIWSGYPPFRNFCRISNDRFSVRWRKLSSFSYPFSLNGVTISAVGPPANDFRMLTSNSESLLAMAPSFRLRYGDFSALILGGGQLDEVLLPERVDLLARLRVPDLSQSAIPPAIEIEPGGLTLLPAGAAGNGADKGAAAASWFVKRDGFLFLEADISGKLTRKLPASLISSCQGWPDKL